MTESNAEAFARSKFSHIHPKEMWLIIDTAGNPVVGNIDTPGFESYHAFLSEDEAVAVCEYKERTYGECYFPLRVL